MVRRAAFVAPMLATLVKPPDHFREQPAGSGQYERKLDGLRGLAVRNGERLTCTRGTGCPSMPASPR